MAAKIEVLPLERVERAILIIRNHKVLLDRDLAVLYGLETRALNQAVRRNLARFPDDFMLQLTRDEIRNISQFVIRPGLKHAPSVFAFTEQGVAMLSGILKNPRAIQVNIEIMRAFVRLRQLLATNAALEKKIASLESKYDQQFKVVFDAIRELMIDDDPGQEKRPEIGFQAIPSRKVVSQRAGKQS